MDADGIIRDLRRPAVFLGSAADSAAHSWFEAPTPGGPLRLSIAGAARHAADAAIALDACAELLDALDEWTGTALAWRWLARPLATTAESHACAAWHPHDAGSDGASEIDAQVDDDVEPSPRHRLELPWMWLRVVSAPPAALAQRLRWLALPVVLAISQMRIDLEELALLEPGGAVLLPESMQSNWRGVLRALEEPARPGWGVPVELKLPHTLRTPIAGTMPVHADAGGCERPWCEIRLGAVRALPADRLAGWYAGELGDLGAQASLWRCASDREAARPLATGSLMPWGAGWALAVETLFGPADAAQGEH